MKPISFMNTLTPPSGKSALAVLLYNRPAYSGAVLSSIFSQQVDGRPVHELYDIWIYQDGLQDRHQSTKAQHDEVEAQVQGWIDQGVLPQGRFVRRARNRGIALQFNDIEVQLFETLGYELAVFFEDDMVLGSAYMQTMHNLAKHLNHDERIGMFSAHSLNFDKDKSAQHAHRHELTPMGHSWGFGMFRSTWQRWHRLYNAYLNVLGDLPYHQRKHFLIKEWMEHCGFLPRATSQDFVKGCLMSALGQIRVSTFPNLSFYIGEEGEHFTADHYESRGYQKSVVYDEALDVFQALDENLYNRLLLMDRKQFVEHPETFDKTHCLQRLTADEHHLMYPLNMTSQHATAEDVVAAYKLFLNRFPEDKEKINALVGTPMSQLLQAFLLCAEFQDRQEVWPDVAKLHTGVAERFKQRLVSRQSIAGIQYK